MVNFAKLNQVNLVDLMSNRWTIEENSTIVDFVKKYGKQWNLLSDLLAQKTSAQIASHYEKCLDPALIKGPFSPEEDQAIIEYVKRKGTQNWMNIKPFLPRRTPKQCRERWWNHLDPNINRNAWLQTEDELIFRCVSLIGQKWSIISRFTPGRTDNAIKNRYHSSISKRIRINPMTGRKELIHWTNKRGKPPNTSRFANPNIVQKPTKAPKPKSVNSVPTTNNNNNSKKNAAKPVNINSQNPLFFDFGLSDPISEPDLTSNDKLKMIKINRTQKNGTLPVTGDDSSYFHHVEMSVPADFFQDDDSDRFEFCEIF